MEIGCGDLADLSGFGWTLNQLPRGLRRRAPWHRAPLCGACTRAAVWWKSLRHDACNMSGLMSDCMCELGRGLT